MAKCPYCYTEIDAGLSGWTDDPIKTPNHFNPVYRGYFILREQHIIELRDEINKKEIDFGITQTIWTSFDGGIRDNHINEMREAIENILIKANISLSDWLSWDENSNPTLGIVDWLDGNRLVKGMVSRGMHIEQIRKIKMILTQDWQESWDSAGIVNGVKTWITPDPNTTVPINGVVTTVSADHSWYSNNPQGYAFRGTVVGTTSGTITWIAGENKILYNFNGVADYVSGYGGVGAYGIVFLYCTFDSVFNKIIVVSHADLTQYTAATRLEINFVGGGSITLEGGGMHSLFPVGKRIASMVLYYISTPRVEAWGPTGVPHDELNFNYEFKPFSIHELAK